MRKIAAILLLLSFMSIVVVESGVFSIADINGLELAEKESQNDAEKDSEKDKSEQKLSTAFSTPSLKSLLAFEITTKAFNSIRFTLAGAYQRIVVPPPEV